MAIEEIPLLEAKGDSLAIMESWLSSLSMYMYSTCLELEKGARK